MSNADTVGGRPTLNDIAVRAGVSLATVDRVLNERGGVSDETTRRVLIAARGVDLKRFLPQPHMALLRIDVLLIRPDTEYFQRLNLAFSQVARKLGRSVTLQRTFLDETCANEIAKRIRSTTSNGIITHIGQEDLELSNALREAYSVGKPVVNVTADFPDSTRGDYVGIDNYRAGRTAAFFMSRMANGDGVLLVLRHSIAYRGQAERVRGFVDGILHRRPDLKIAEILDVRDQDAIARSLVSTALKKQRNVVGVYCAGDGRRGVGDALHAAGSGNKVIFVAHELTETTAAMLRLGVLDLVIDENPERQAAQAVDVVLHRLGNTASAPSTTVEFSLHTVENIPLLFPGGRSIL